MRTTLLLQPLYLALASVLAFLGACGSVWGQSFDWQTATPESQGFSKEKLDALAKVMAAKKTNAFLVIRNDKIVYEWYADGHDSAKPQPTASLAKALVGGLSLSVAITDGKMTLDDKAANYIPEWKGKPRKSQITLRQLGSHTSGLADAESEGLPHEKLTGWKGDFWKRLDVPNDPFSIARDKTETLFDPGQQFQYSNPGIAMLTYCVTAAIKDTEHKDIRTLLRERVMKPIGVTDDEWSVGYGKTFIVDGLPLVASWGGAAFTPRAAARIGRLVLREGDWDGKRILSKEAVQAMTHDAGLPGHCGMGWWTNNGGRYKHLPKDAVWGAGAGDQVLLVIPSLNLIMVRNGQTLEPGPDEPPIRQDDVFTRYHDYRVRILFEPLVAAITEETKRADGPLGVKLNKDQIQVTSTFRQGWKAVVDRRRGGVITHFQLGDGPNLVSDDGSRFEGMFNTIYVDFKETGKESGYVAKGALYSFGTVSRMEVLENRTDRVVVEVEGTSGNQVEPKKDVVRYRQRYTFLADRVICDGEVEWLFDKVVAGSHLELLQLQCLFAPDTLSGELRVLDNQRGPIALPQTNSKGRNLPTGIDYPLTVEVPLKGGNALRIRSLQMPESINRARFYWNEYPKQIEQKRGFAFKAWEGWPGNDKVDFGRDKIVKYRYEVVVAPLLPPNSPVIQSLTWAPKETIVRKANGSDNWPLTWADDDHLYTAYGDGWGFEPLLTDKLSLGLARIEGGPTEFNGVNLRAPTLEQKGQGPEGKKASGILMVDGVLYLWVRNAGNSQLAWSTDHGKTWEWADWKFTTSFGCPTFLNFGKNYAGARDDYVYIYSHDADSAYQAADRMVLARVPKAKIRERDAYEFFKGLDPEKQPIWSKDITERGAVFSCWGQCYRSGITYNAVLKRYLWCQTLPGDDPRYKGGLAIYDAPEPWGPWTTVFYTEGWDVGPGETSSFPTKWISTDGTTLYLVFSGDDSFAVRKASLTLRKSE